MQAQSSRLFSSQQITLLSSWAVPETILALTYTEVDTLTQAVPPRVQGPTLTNNIRMQAVPSLKEYLELFDGAISATLDSERIWPQEAI